MPAGNLNPDNNTDDFLKNHLSHYLEGLARLDIASPTYMVQQVPYDWIYKNLQNADGTISIRPFIELLKYSIDHCLSEIVLTDDSLPILAPKYFADGENRRKAAKSLNKNE